MSAPNTITPLNIGDQLPDWITDFPTNQGSTLPQLSTANNNESSGGSLNSGALIVMLRHTACPFCQELLNDLKQALPELKAAGITPVIVHQATESPFIADMLAKAGHADTHRIADPDRILYDLFDIKNGNPWQLFGPHVIWGLIRVLSKGLRPPTKKIGSVRRLNGTVLIQANTLTKRHNYTSQADRANLNQLCRHSDVNQLINQLQFLTPLHWVALTHAGITCFLTGLIWTIQIVHYPLFAWVPPNAFTGQDTTEQPNSKGYEREHMHRITFIVGPAMIIEMATAVALTILIPADLRPIAIAALVALFIIWIATATTQGPLHMKIADNPDRTLIRKLVNSNWLRTALWSARALAAVAILPALFMTAAG